jgi:RNA polymerase sigma-70 factor (ECF subfamily)
VKRESDADSEFGKLYEKNFRGLIARILKYVADYETAEDLAQECFIKIYDRRNNLDFASDNARNYLYKTAKNAAIDYKRKLARDCKNSSRLLPELKEMDKDFYSQVEDYVIDGEVLSTVHDILSEFPEKTREVFFDRVIHEKNLRTISEERNITLYKIGKIEKELLFYLRNRLKLYCGEVT